jgi:hypothetical protein
MLVTMARHSGHGIQILKAFQALNQAAHSAQQEDRDVVSNTFGIVFLGTPHKGSSAASYGRVAYMLTKVFAFQSTNTKLLRALEKNSETLDRISTDFYQTLETYKNLHIASFSEEKQVRFGAIGIQIVKPDSAKIGHARENWGSISEDHRNMAKYATLRDDGFVKVTRIIKERVGDIERQLCKYFSTSPIPVKDEKENLRSWMLITQNLKPQLRPRTMKVRNPSISTYRCSQTYQLPRVCEQFE